MVQGRCAVVSACAVMLIASLLADAKLERVFVLHRHGARSPMAVIDGALDCDLPYCELTNQGKAQLTAVGKVVYERYAGLLNLTEYDVTKMQSISTSVPRVVLSSESLITGMFPNALPFVDFVPNTEDLQMSSWTSWPSWSMGGASQRNISQISTQVLNVVDHSTMMKLADYFGLPVSVCGDPAVAGNCLSVISDTYFCTLMDAKHAALPAWIAGMHAQMISVRAIVLGYTCGYFPQADPQDRAVGSYGYPLASAMIAAMKYSPTDGSFNYSFFLRGAHDWTLINFYSAVGVWNTSNFHLDVFAVNFGETVMVELHATDTGLVLRAFRAVPGQTYSSDYSFGVAVEPLGLKCVSASGEVQWTNETDCDIDSVWRAINLTAPASPEAECFVTEAQLQQHDCTGRDAPAPGSTCLFFRENCPSQPCGGVSGQIADAATGFSCRSLTPPKKDRYSAQTFGLTGGITAAAGIVVGAFFMAVSRKRLYRATNLK